MYLVLWENFNSILKLYNVLEIIITICDWIWEAIRMHIIISLVMLTHVKATGQDTEKFASSFITSLFCDIMQT